MRAPALSQAYVLAVFQTNYYLNKPNPDDVTGFEWWQVQCNLMMLCVCNYACIHVYIIYIYMYAHVCTYTMSYVEYIYIYVYCIMSEFTFTCLKGI